METTEMTFGVEIETIAGQKAIDAGLVIGPYKRGIQVPYLPQGWTAERDGSIEPAPAPGRPEYACEIVSPVLKGAAGIAQVVEVCKQLQDKGHRVNVSCGVHVHVGFDAYAPGAAITLARLVTIVSHNEKGIYATTGTKSRERSRWCKGVRMYGNKTAAKSSADCDRYHLLNLTNLANGSKPTVEFRAFSGSLNQVKIVGWIMVCLGLVQKSHESRRDAEWTPSKEMPLSAGQGEREVERLLWSLKWGSKCQGCHHRKGSVGLIESEVTLNQVKAEFRRLAKQYDAAA